MVYLKKIKIEAALLAVCMLFFACPVAFAQQGKCIAGYWKTTGGCNGRTCTPIRKEWVCTKRAPTPPPAPPANTEPEYPKDYNPGGGNCSYDYDLVFNPPWCDAYGCTTTRKGTLECSPRAVRVSSPGIGTLDCKTCEFEPDYKDYNPPSTPEVPATPAPSPSYYPPKYNPPTYNPPTCRGGNCQ